MGTIRITMSARIGAATIAGMIATLVLVGCAGEADPIARAQAQVSAKEKAVADAQADLAAASDTFCGASKDYIAALGTGGPLRPR